MRLLLLLLRLLRNITYRRLKDDFAGWRDDVLKKYGGVDDCDVDDAKASLVGDRHYAEDAISLEEDACLRREHSERLYVVKVALPQMHVHKRPRHGVLYVRIVIRE